MRHRSAAVVLVAMLLTGCDPAVMPTPSLGPPPSAIDATAWATAMCQAVDQLEQGIGDPTTGDDSPAWFAFESATAGGDTEALTAAANGVLGHLTEGARMAGSATGYPDGAAAAAEMTALLDDLAEGVRVVRDGTLAGDADVQNEGRRLIDAALEQHYEQALGQMAQVPLDGAPLPCL